MKTSLGKSISVLAMALALTSAAFAVPVNGSIGFTGPYTANDPNLTLATQISFANSGPTQITTDGTVSGSFAGIAAGTPVTMFTPIVINQGGGPNPTGVTLPGGSIWSVGVFSLTLTSLVEQFNTAQTLVLYGVGTLSNGNPADNSIGDWVATFSRSGSSFTFAATSSSVPDGGSTALLLGLGLLGLGALARRSRKA